MNRPGGPPVHGASAFHRLHEEMGRLLALRQPPVIALLLRTRFLGAALDQGRAAWLAYAHPEAGSLARAVASFPLEGLPLAELEAMLRVLEAAREHPPPAAASAEAWHHETDAALAATRAALEAQRDLLAGAADDEGEPVSGVEIRVPVVAELVTGGECHPYFAKLAAGRILRVQVEADLDERGAGGPGLSIDGDPSPLTRAILEQALVQSGRIRIRGAPRLRECRFRVRWNAPGARLVGRSAGFPFALAAAAARADLAAVRTVLRLAPALAATGDLAEGRVAGVRPETLPYKVQACFHTPVQTLVVPEEQEGEACREAGRLTAAHPARRLTIVGIRELDQGLRDPRVTAVRRRPYHTAAGLWLRWSTRGRRRVLVPLSAAVFLALALSAIAFLWRNDPASVSWEGDHVVLRNHNGLVCRRFDLPYRPGLDFAPRADWGNHLMLADVDGDRVPEVIAIHGSVPRGHDLLSVLDRRGRRLWQARSTEVLGPGGPFEADVVWRPFYPLDGPGFGAPSPGRPLQILTIRRSIQRSLTIVDRIDARTGRLLGALRNTGHIESSWLVDVDNDGRREMTLVGTDNRSGRGLVIVLDPSRVDAPPSPGRIGELPGAADPEGLRAGVTAAWSFALDRFSPAERAACVRVESGEGGMITCTVTGAGPGAILYDLKAEDVRRPVVVSVRLTDGYRMETRARLGEKVSPAVWGAEEMRLRGEVRTLAESGWIALSDVVESFPPGRPDAHREHGGAQVGPNQRPGGAATDNGHGM